MINIKHIKPKKELTKYLRKITLFQSENNLKYKQKLTPSAFTYLSYNHEIIPTSIFGTKRIKPVGRLQVAGPKINEKIYVEYNGRLSQILIEFTASGFYYLFQHSPCKLTNKLTEISNFILPDNYKQLEKDLHKFESVYDHTRILEDLLVEKSFSALPPLVYIDRAIKYIEKNFGNVCINDVIDLAAISKRQLDRKFLEVVGVTPKCYAKIIQLNYVIGLMASKKYDSIQDLAQSAEFYDLSHLAHRFKELTGFTPNEFLKSDQHIAMKYFNDKF